MAILGVVALVSLVYFFLIGPQKEQNRRLDSQTKAKQSDLQKIRQTIKEKEATAKAMTTVSKKLDQAEIDVATGDVNAWTYDTMRQFKADYQVDIPSIGQPTQSEVDLIPKFPYKQINFSIFGSGYYRDIGKFIADFENKYPHMRVINLVIEPASDAESKPEKLSFRMQIAALVKPNA
jgi:Tfp pilus assembly protein PilO